MKAVQAHQIQVSGRKAQVIVLVGEGLTKKSVTRHAVWENGKWVAHNPDQSVRDRHTRGNRALIDAQDAVTTAKRELAAAEKVEEQEKKDRLMKWAKVLLRQAELRCAAAQDSMNAIQRDFPLKVYFVQ